MKFNIITLFPEMFDCAFGESIIKRAQEKGIVEINLINLRDFAEDRHKTVDDTPYGGGPGMVIKVDVMDRALGSLGVSRQSSDDKIVNIDTRHTTNEKQVILMTPQGRPFDQAKAQELSALSEITLVCGHYEGFDERIREHLVDEEISLGDFVLSGGEIAAMAIVDACTRLLPGALGHDASSEEESFSLEDEHGHRLLEYPVYTRPEEYKGWKVPEILKGGHHAEIQKWRLNEAKKRTLEKRPDLLQ